eukprot:TRINITY_DN1146_c0_g1_i1.p1 TRINITY_DN1146_c0_g1~~TRINITY_DN1146_c0_g1_i1.p1  ORF type:complete len:766 (-),score=186.35 TRINITY_DN1146_c0_g1_i1:107-2404(-)
MKFGVLLFALVLQINGDLFEWIWIGGGNGTSRGSDGSPPPRTESQFSLSMDGETFWIWGGRSTLNNQDVWLSDLWAYEKTKWVWKGGSNQTNQATIPTGANAVPSSRDRACLAIDSSSNVYLFGGRDYNAGFLNDLWIFDSNQNSWRQITPVSDPQWNGLGQKGIPSSRLGSQCWIDPTSNTFILYGGAGNPKNSSFADAWTSALADMWEYRDGAWYMVSGYDVPNVPSAYSGIQNPGSRAGSLLTVTSDAAYFFGGKINSNEDMKSDLWEWNFAEKSWKFLFGREDINVYSNFSLGNVSIIGSRSNGALWIDSNGTFWIYGGEGWDGDSRTWLSDFYKIEGGVSTCVGGSAGGWVSPVYNMIGESFPGNRARPAYWMDSQNNMYLFGGQVASVDGEPYRNDLWRYSLPTPPLSGSDETLNVGMIVGVVVGGLILIVAVGVGIFFVVRRRSRSRRDSSRSSAVPLKKMSTVEPQYANQPDSTNNYTSMHSSNSTLVETASDPVHIKFKELKLIEKVGEGGYGIVWKAKWKGNIVAVKQLKEFESSGMTRVNEFLQEAQLMRSMRPHPNVVTYFGVSTDKSMCIITEFMEGGSLKTFFKLNPITVDRAVKIMRDIATGMSHLESQKIVHKDLAARNVLLNAANEAKVSDFGLSRVSTSGDNNTVFTSADVGPIKWMPIESLRYRQFSTKSDVYAFGVTCIEILTRRDPYPEINLLEFSMRVLAEGLHLRDSIPMDVPRPLRELILSCLSDLPEQRPSFQDILAKLR